MNNLDLLKHHIHFLAKNHGRRELQNDIEFIHSDKPDFNIAVPLTSDNLEKINPQFNIFLASWVNKDKFGTHWKKAGSLTYMILPEKENTWQINNNLTIKKVTTESELTDFSIVQGRGFCDTEEEFNEWHPWLKEQNFRNFPDETQSYYIAYKDNLPVGVCLCLLYNSIAGIYAVATLPEYRKQAISTTIMNYVIEELKENNILQITLQVSTDSYAHSFYKKLGFEDAFECEILSGV